MTLRSLIFCLVLVSVTARADDPDFDTDRSPVLGAFLATELCGVTSPAFEGFRPRVEGYSFLHIDDIWQLRTGTTASIASMPDGGCRCMVSYFVEDLDEASDLFSYVSSEMLGARIQEYKPDPGKFEILSESEASVVGAIVKLTGADHTTLGVAVLSPLDCPSNALK